MTAIDISCDLGEATTADEHATERELWPLVDSANVACGGHAGDATSMFEAATLARRLGVRLGAHPSFPDREGFGRTRIEIGDDDLVASLASQIAALRAIAEAAGVQLERVKAHGALHNLAHRDLTLARLLVRATEESCRGSAIVCAASSAMETAARERGFPVVREAFADRRYLPDGALVPRSDARALLEGPGDAAAQAVSIATRNVAVAIDGSEIAVAWDTICIHSDMRDSVRRLVAIRAALAAAGVGETI
ncbi:MAG: 5-oxoprolinase subunit PxpA [Acidobacteria bacterium]|nr:5-oxoprolinase subunit PxpA [Acidobacteriota bacterium]